MPCSHANGWLLAEPFRHEFAVSADERRAVESMDARDLEALPTQAGTRDLAVVRLDRPLDYPFLSDVFQIRVCPERQLLALAKRNGTFNQRNPETVGECQVVVNMALKYLAGPQRYRSGQGGQACWGK
jgi:hypothetical protein